MITKTILGALFTAAMTLTPASASTYLFPFTNPAGNVGASSYSYTVTVGSSSATIAASTLVASGTAPNLYDNDSGGEYGLGTANNSSHGIVPNEGVVLDFSQVHNITSIALDMTGAIGGTMDDWEIFGSNTKPTSLSSPGALLLGGVQQLGTGYVTIPDTYTYYTIEVPTVAGCSPDVLLTDLQVTTSSAAPEPGTFFLLGFGAIGLVAGRRFLRRSSSKA